MKTDTKKKLSPEFQNIDTVADEGTDRPPILIRNELAQRGLTGWDGYKCCIRARNIATRFIDEVGDVFEFYWDQIIRGRLRERSVQDSLVFPATGPTRVEFPKRFEVTPGRVPGGPAIMIIGVLAILTRERGTWESDGEFPIPEAAPQAQLAVKALRATATSLRKKTESDCYSCIRKKLWGQKKLRRSVTILSSTNLTSVQGTRSIGDRRLNLRTPHK